MKLFLRFSSTIALFSAIFVVPAGAQWNPLNPVTAAKEESDGVTLTMQAGILRVRVCSAAIIRVTYAAGTALPDTPQYAVTKNSWPRAAFTTQFTDNEIVLATPQLKVNITRKNGTILFSDLAGKKLFQDFDRSLTPVEVNGEKTYHSEMFSNLWDSTEAFYGLGQHQAGVWNYHGEDVDLSQDNTNISVPMFLSSKGYGIFWNNPSRSRFNNRFLHALYLSSEVADTVDYYFLYGPDFDKIIASYREMTGAAPLFGKWAYGFWQCKNKYSSQEEILSVAHKYRELHIPVDNIVQDWFWWNTMGDPVFNKNYPDPQAMMKRPARHQFPRHVFLLAILSSRLFRVRRNGQAGYFIARTKVGGFHPAGQALYDAFNPDARKYYWQLINKGLFQIGADAWWLDTDEPETEGRETNILVTNKVAIGSGARYANLFPLMTTAAVYEGQRNTSEPKARLHSFAFGVRGNSKKFRRRMVW